MFEKMNLSGQLLKALTTMGYTEPTMIQKQVIPVVLEGKDVFGCAETGTGKTAAFALPILQMLAMNTNSGRRGLKALVLAPTRELAMQIDQSFNDYGKFLSLKHTTVFGGVSQVNQVKKIRAGLDIIVATPGRLLDLMQQGIVRLDTVEYLVLDEADRMLDMGFASDIKKIVAKLPAKRQTMLFSATAPKEILTLAYSLLNNPVRINVDAVKTPPLLVDQSVYHIDKEKKRKLLNYVLKSRGKSQTLVFTRTKHGADRVTKELRKNGINAEAIHGNKSQSARERALKDFKDKTINVLVATDIASRGIDVVQLPLVINFELPEQAETYIHRIGRTGRAGQEGAAISFCSVDEKHYLTDIQKLIRKNIPVISNPVLS